MAKNEGSQEEEQSSSFPIRYETDDNRSVWDKREIQKKRRRSSRNRASKRSSIMLEYHSKLDQDPKDERSLSLLPRSERENNS
ncbi:hypothetical protein Glove_140g18 [Diversispora epigaea]|uniref:Uncharacterized protein n=1 Tax=Diversispora epigaea TaxID=1348612 RepID=A0A397IZ02_9GLOM|nr:hypothetical protein Glove_140g18 [Diversispora epigaea]